MTCPFCQRPVAVARPNCLYCGAALPDDVVALARATAAAAGPKTSSPGHPGLRPDAGQQPAGDRVLVVLDLAEAEPGALARALALPRFEAGQRVRRGGYQLHRIGGRDEAGAEAARLRSSGLDAWLVPEVDVQAAQPVVARGGRRSGHTLALRSALGELTVSSTDLLLGVRGPIAREYQRAPASSRGLLQEIRSLKQLRLATLEQGYRYHLHRRGDPRPIELNPDGFDFDAAAEGSTLLALTRWVEDLCQGIPLDDAFRRETPVLAPSAESGGLPAAMGRRDGKARPREGGSTVLDNVAQFRFYSAWRGALERLRRPGVR